MTTKPSGKLPVPCRSTYLDTPEDLQWAQEVHGVPNGAKVVVLYGNEDSPERIDCYTQPEPLTTDSPFAVKAGGFWGRMQ